MNIKSFPNLLLISGTGKNTGKTTFSCDIIRLNRSLDIIAVKISSFFHKQDFLIPIIDIENKYQIFEEIYKDKHTDSSLMLGSGAKRVFYIQCEKEFQYKAFLEIHEIIGGNVPILCESGGLRNYIKPGVHVLMGDVKNNEKTKLSDFTPDMIIDVKKENSSNYSQNINFNNGRWSISSLK